MFGNSASDANNSILKPGCIVKEASALSRSRYSMGRLKFVGGVDNFRVPESSITGAAPDSSLASV